MLLSRVVLSSGLEIGATSTINGQGTGVCVFVLWDIFRPTFVEWHAVEANLFTLHLGRFLVFWDANSLPILFHPFKKLLSNNF